MDLQEELFELESGFWRAAGDPRFYREHMDTDGRCVFHLGVMDKGQTLEAVGAAESWSSFEFETPTVTSITADVAVLTYTAAARRGDEHYAATVSSVYVQRGGHWKLVLHQQTPRPEPGVDE